MKAAAALQDLMHGMDFLLYVSLGFHRGRSPLLLFIHLLSVSAVNTEISELGDVAYRKQILYHRIIPTLFFGQELRFVVSLSRNLDYIKCRKPSDCFRFKLAYIQTKSMPHPAVFAYRSGIFKYIVKHINILDWNLFY